LDILKIELTFFNHHEP